MRERKREGVFPLESVYKTLKMKMKKMKEEEEGFDHTHKVAWIICALSTCLYGSQLSLDTY